MRRSDKDDLLLFTSPCKVGVFGKKAITGMNGIDLAPFGTLDDPLYIQKFRD